MRVVKLEADAASSARGAALDALANGYVPLLVLPGSKSPAVPGKQYQRKRPNEMHVRGWS